MMAMLFYLGLGAAFIVAVLVTVICVAVLLLEQLAVAADPSEAHDRDATMMVHPDSDLLTPMELLVEAPRIDKVTADD